MYNTYILYFNNYLKVRLYKTLYMDKPTEFDYDESFSDFDLEYDSDDSSDFDYVNDWDDLDDEEL